MNDPISIIASTVAPQGGGPFVVAAASSPPAAESAVPAAPDAGVESPQVSIEDAVGALREQAIAAGAELEFSIDRELDRVIVILRDVRDGSVLRQIPQEEVLRIARLLRDQSAPLVQAIV